MPELASQASTFDDIAVALSLAASKLRLDLEQVEILAARVGLPVVSMGIAVAELQRNLDLVVAAHHFFKDNAGVEAEMRALAMRKKRGTWFNFSKIAAL